MTPFHDLAEYVALPRIGRLRLSPDGERLVVTVQELARDKKTYVTALWQVDPAGTAEPRRLTRSAAGEAEPAFLPDGSVLFASKRQDPATEEAEDEVAGLWCLPAGGGEAYPVASRPSAIGGLAVARDSGTIVFSADTLPGDAADDADRRKRRKDTGVTAILHESYPIRYWDHELGPAAPRRFVLSKGEPERDITPDAGGSLIEQSAAVTPDGSTVVTGWLVPAGRGEKHADLVAIDTATGERRTLASEPGVDFHSPVTSPDGLSVLCERERHGTTDEPLDLTLWLVPLDGGSGRDLTPGLDLWPRGAVWSPDSRTVYFRADERGRGPVFAVDVATGEVRRITGDDAAYADLAPSPGGRYLYALRSGIDAPATPVRLDLSAESEPLKLPAPGLPLTLPGTLTEVATTAADGTEIRGWLVLPEASAPAPLLLWPHGGPHMSSNDWSWRWNPWIMAAHGYAVLLPDPALSTGYGLRHIRRGHGRWGDVTFDDLMAITDATVARDDIDASRTAVMGGSFGGYMANWIAGHTDRFAAIVTHASLWKFDFKVTADVGTYFIREFGDPAERPETWRLNDPSQHAAAVRTPMLVIHGDRDYRVPVGNALWLWWDLIRHNVDAKFLYYPDENHWILTPGNARVWYETVFAFLAQHVLGEKWKRPELI